jgi:hypothetical protein
MRTTLLLAGLLLALRAAPALADPHAPDLVPPREIHVVVMEPGGKVLPGATVSLLTSDQKPQPTDRSLIEAGRLRISGQDGRAVFTSLFAGDYTLSIEMHGALKQTIGPIRIGQKCFRLPELRVILPFWISTCY